MFSMNNHGLILLPEIDEHDIIIHIGNKPFINLLLLINHHNQHGILVLIRSIYLNRFIFLNFSLSIPNNDSNAESFK